jgi:2-succinyl-5-enolpyruvyl-6-hydroxy-3-cyclohexene-1-carboxylate synthase
MSTLETRVPSRAEVATAPNATYAFVTAFFEEFARSGVKQICISPGSRSSPLAVVAATTPEFRIWSHIDERSSGFFALGLAKALREPVGLICTSGSAPANYFPAVMEAYYAGVPLIIMSADRPAELRDWGAGQAVDQVKLYGPHVCYFAEMPVPDAGSRMLRFARTSACRAVAESQGLRPGPVHLNWPFREPLEPIADSDDRRSRDWAEGDLVARRGRPESRPYVASAREIPLASEAQIQNLADRIQEQPRGIIAAGAMDEPASFASAVAKLAKAAGWPVLAEPTSGLRRGAHISGAQMLAGSDLFLRDSNFSGSNSPEFVLRFGGTPVSKALRLWLEAALPPNVVVVDPGSRWNEPSHLISDYLAVDPTDLCNRLAAALESRSDSRRESAWLQTFERAERATQDGLHAEILAAQSLLEPRATKELCEFLPADAILYVSNSMPIRDLDAFMPIGKSGLRVLSNRGTNGIDGMVSSALGAAAANLAPVFLLTGDLAFLYDLGALLATCRYPLRATIVVLNNDGGGIFSFLPIARHGEEVRFEEIFTTPHGVDLTGCAELFGVHYSRVSTVPAYREALEKSAACDGVSIIEIPIDREDNLAHFRSLVASVGRSVADGERGKA